MKVVITGADGQLGLAFQKELARRQVAFFGTDISTCDITNAKSVDALLDLHQPTVLINCAAYNLVDDAEAESDVAFAVNAHAVKILALACATRKIKFVHYSTDYVFDGQKGACYTEEDTPNPLNVYGISKRDGENWARTLVADHLVLRTSWVYGEGQQNFLYKVTQWASKNKVLRMSADEVSVPTSVEDLVQVTLLALDKGITGLYHLTSSGYASRYEWAKYFLGSVGADVSVAPAPMASFQLKAARPLFSAMSNEKISAALGVTIPSWQKGVDRYVRAKGSLI